MLGVPEKDVKAHVINVPEKDVKAHVINMLQQVREKTLQISGNIKSQQRNKRHRAEPNGNVRTEKHNNRNKKNLLDGLKSKMEITKQRI